MELTHTKQDLGPDGQSTASPEEPALTPEELAGIQVLIDSLPFYAMIIDDEHRILRINEVAAKALGVKPSDVIGQRCPEVIHRTEGPFPGCPLEDALRDESYVARALHNEATGDWIHSAVVPIRRRNGHGRRLCFHLGRDITEEKRVAEELDRSLERHQAIGNILHQLNACQSASEVLAAVLDSVLPLSWLGLGSSAAAFLLDGSELELVVKRDFDPRLAVKCARVPLGNCLCGRAAKLGQTVVSYDAARDHDRWVAGTAEHGHVVVPLREGKRVLGVLNFYLPPKAKITDELRDFLENVAAIASVTLNRLHVQKQLTVSERLASLGLLSSIVVHDVRVPLNALSIKAQSACRALRRGATVDRESVLEKLQSLDAEIERINRYLEEYRATFRGQSAGPGALAIKGVIMDASRFLRAEAERRSVEVILRFEDEEAMVKSELGKVRRVVLNILLNAIQATPVGGVVRVSTAAEGEHVVVTIADSGPGLPRKRGESLREIFEPFVTQKEHGTGLGLAICARLIEELDGWIRVDSELGKGTRFHIGLPAVPEGESATPDTNR